MWSLNVSPRKLFRWFRRPQLWVSGDGHLHHDNAPAHASCLVHKFLEKHQTTHVTQLYYSLDLVLCNFWLFPKPKSSLKGKRFQTVHEIQENMMGQLMVIGRTVWGPKVPKLKGLSHHCPMYNVSCIFFNKWLYFSYYMAGYFLDRPHIFPVMND